MITLASYFPLTLTKFLLLLSAIAITGKDNTGVKFPLKGKLWKRDVYNMHVYKMYIEYNKVHTGRSFVREGEFC